MLHEHEEHASESHPIAHVYRRNMGLSLASLSSTAFSWRLSWCQHFGGGDSCGGADGFDLQTEANKVN